MDISKILRDHGATILAGAACLGVVGTGILAALETPKAIAAVDEYKTKQKDVDMPVKKGDIAKIYVKTYWPAGLTCLATISAIIAGDRINARQKAELIAGMGALLAAANDKQPIPEPPKDKEKEHKDLWYEANYGYFYANPYKVAAAICRLHEKFQNDGYAYITEFYKDIGIYDDKVKGWELADMGWTLDSCLDMGWNGLSIDILNEDDPSKPHKIVFNNEVIVNTTEARITGDWQSEEERLMKSGEVPA